MTKEALNQAWDLFMTDDLAGARNLLEELDGEFHQEFSFLNLQGYLHLAEKDYASAFASFNHYLVLARERKDKEQEHIGLHQLAMAYREQGQMAEALALIVEEARLLELYFPHDSLKQSVNHYEQAYLRFLMGQAKEGLPLMEHALKQALVTDDLIAQGCAYRGLGQLTADLGQTEQSRAYYEQAISKFTAAGDSIAVAEVEELKMKN